MNSRNFSMNADVAICCVGGMEFRLGRLFSKCSRANQIRMRSVTINFKVNCFARGSAVHFGIEVVCITIHLLFTKVEYIVTGCQFDCGREYPDFASV